MATRDEVVRAPRSGAKPLFGEQPPRSERPSQARPQRSSAPASAPRAASPSRPAQRPSGGSRASGAAVRAGQVTRASRQFAAPEFKNYQGVILAEFVLAELLVAATPIASKPHETGFSPYQGQDMVKMLSLGLVYFLLSLLSIGGGGMARLGAWFGGLILIVVGLNEANNIAQDLDLFGKVTSALAGAKNG